MWKKRDFIQQNKETKIIFFPIFLLLITIKRVSFYPKKSLKYFLISDVKVARIKLNVALNKPFSESIFEYQVKLPIGS